MKKILIIIAMLAVSVAASAQTSLKGTWFTKGGAMGINASESLSFSGDQTGTVKKVTTMNMAMNMLGVKVDGEFTVSSEGTFTLDGTDIAVKWDPTKISSTIKKPLTVTVKGQQDPDKQKEMQESFDKSMEKMKKDMAKDEVYTDVQIKNKKLRLTWKNEEGKSQTKKYDFVK